jgi:hypothetical protein
MAEQAQADLAVGDDRPAPHRIAFGAGERGRDSFISLRLPGEKEKNEEQYPHTISMPWFLSGTERMRLPVAL